MQISPNLHFQVILQADLRWPLTLICDLLIAWTYEGSHIISINQVWLQSDFNFSNEAIFTFSAYLTTWPQMTFDLGILPLTAWTYEGSHIISINQVWFQSDFNFSNEATFTFSAYLTTWPQMTFDLINKWGFPCCNYDPTLVEIHQTMWKLEPNVNLFSQQTTSTDNNINRQQWTKWSLCVFPAKAGDTKNWNYISLNVIILMKICCLFLFEVKECTFCNFARIWIAMLKLYARQLDR